jgi:hypothetical protein
MVRNLRFSSFNPSSAYQLLFCLSSYRVRVTKRPKQIDRLRNNLVELRQKQGLKQLPEAARSCFQPEVASRAFSRDGVAPEWRLRSASWRTPSRTGPNFFWLFRTRRKCSVQYRFDAENSFSPFTRFARFVARLLLKPPY